MKKGNEQTTEVSVQESDEQSSNQQNWRRGIWAQFIIAVGQLFIGIVLTGMVLYLAAQYKMNAFEPFSLATVASLLGGFPLVASFGEQVDQRLKKRLMVLGGLYIFSAIFFVVFGFYQAADVAQILPKNDDGTGIWQFNLIYIVTFYGGALALTFGMLMTLEIIPQLLGLKGIRIETVRDKIKNVFKRRH